MKNILKLKYGTMFLAVLAMMLITSCDDAFEYDLPEANSKTDQTPPNASFSVSETNDFLTFTFGNTSSSATDYVWDYGDGNTSTGVDGLNTFPDEGTYTVTLTATDKLGVVSTTTQTVEVVEPEIPLAIVPEIGAADFEDGDGVCGSGDSRDCWRISGASIHQTTSDGQGDAENSKTRGAKYPVGSDNNRVTYQAITVSPNSKYLFTVFYALQSDGDSVRASIIDGQLGNYDAFEGAALLGQSSGSINLGKGNFSALTIEFETGASGEIAILMDHDGNDSESYLDNVSIVPILE